MALLDLLSVYPRWRGEHRCVRHFNYNVCGLSPLARGTLCTDGFSVVVARFIPAGAGNTTPDQNRKVADPVYPRWRGEHISLLAKTSEVRFIPAGAGNTASSERTSAVITVYPRWRGEHYYYVVRDKRGRGLSPLARGTPLADSLANLPSRFIPAGAGNTLSKLLKS